MPSPRAVVAVDLGKSRCRVVASRSEVLADIGADRRRHADGPGAPGLASAGGVAAALEAILPLTARLDVPISALSVGAAGAWTAPGAAADLAGRLADAVGAPVAVTSDVVSAHVGALGGRAGVLLIAGTGAAALGVGRDSAVDSGTRDEGAGARARLIDGWGPELGDFGSGSWLGREALRAVLRASVGLASRTSLTDAVSASIGDPSGIHAWLAQDGPLPRRLATLAPLVLDAAQAGDPIAREIAADGIRLLVASAIAASTTSAAVAQSPSAIGDAVVLHGGLTDHAWFRAELETALADAGRRVVAPAGDALDGALLLARRTDLPHERFVHRAE